MGVVGGSHRWLGEKMIVRVWDKNLAEWEEKVKEKVDDVDSKDYFGNYFQICTISVFFLNKNYFGYKLNKWILTYM